MHVKKSIVHFTFLLSFQISDIPDKGWKVKDGYQKIPTKFRCLSSEPNINLRDARDGYDDCFEISTFSICHLLSPDLKIESYKSCFFPITAFLTALLLGCIGSGASERL